MNLSILDRNILHSFGGLDYPEEAERVYLAKRDRDLPLLAEQDALAWEQACRVILPAVRFAENQHDGRDHGALDFIRARFLNWPRAEAIEACRAERQKECETLMAKLAYYMTKETLPAGAAYELEPLRRQVNRALNGAAT